MLKYTAPQVAFPLALIFNISLNEGKIPDDRKRANVVPIHKPGDLGCIKYYRPISLYSVVGKLLARVVTRNVVEYMQTSGLVSPQQHGFHLMLTSSSLTAAKHLTRLATQFCYPNSTSIAFAVHYGTGFPHFCWVAPNVSNLEGFLRGGFLLSPGFLRDPYWAHFCSISLSWTCPTVFNRHFPNMLMIHSFTYLSMRKVPSKMILII